LATCVDVMKLVGINRVLVKHSLYHAQKGGLIKLPGLWELEKLRQSKTPKPFTPDPLTEKTYGFFFGPCLNAPGRLGDAKHALHLLLAENVIAAKKQAGKCYTLNERRKAIQRKGSKLVMSAAGEKRNSKVIVVADKKLPAGVGGIIASDLREEFNRPVIVCAWQTDGKGGGYWKGSGRSIEEFNLGQAIQDAVQVGVIDDGGGHEMACGLSFAEEKLDAFVKWINENSGLDKKQFVRKVEIIAPAETYDAKTWFGIYRALEPFGNGNAEPSLIVRRGRLVSIPLKLGKDDNGCADSDEKKTVARSVWALRAVFEKRRNSISIECIDLASAEKWTKNRRYNFDLVLTEWQRGINRIFSFRVRPIKRSPNPL